MKAPSTLTEMVVLDGIAASIARTPVKARYAQYAPGSCGLRVALSIFTMPFYCFAVDQGTTGPGSERELPSS